MKKVFFSFAVATMMASLVACNGTSGQNNEGQDSTAVEVNAEEVEEAPEEEIITDIHGDFCFQVPDGWTGKSQSFGSNLYYEKDGKAVASFTIKTVGAAFDESKLDFHMTADNKVAEGEKIGEYTWTVYAIENGNSIHCLAVSPFTDKEGYLRVDGFNNGGFDDVMKQALQGIKLLK